jgi:iron complex transport system substrate-binding protein
MEMREVDQITAEIVDAAYQLHRRIGPGLMESVYSSLLAQMLAQRGLHVERERKLTFEVDGLRFEDGLRLDLLVDGRVIVELKSIEKLAPVHSKQFLTYLRVLDLRVGLLINFGAPTLKEGIQRVVNAHRPSPASPLRLNQGIG